ncbi:MAG: 16S rRNA (cytosine(1402)-N(4))-methyltransferase RsmH [Bacteroidetes bacterium]|nr:16S rRNA (cytosine(1402)-N(4))-methyltransferase RsmH [Bacteroidota bacterium]
MKGSSYHVPVLFKEAIDALDIKPGGIYVDCTFGGGGHARGILEKLNAGGRLIAFDQDADAKQNIPDDDRLIFVPHNFRHLQRFLRLHHFEKVNGVLADLGVSSFQFDEATRGFSIRFNGPLDMRMDKRGEKTALEILLQYSAPQLHKMFEQYGEVTNSKTLANHIVEQRGKIVLKDIESFRTLLHPVIKGNPNKYLAQVFQALRIEVNDEMGALKDMLLQLPSVLLPKARVAIITFHSIEDRIVKKFFKQAGITEDDNNPFSTTQRNPEFNILFKKPIIPAAAELELNPRARSAKLRVAEKV